MLTVSVRQLAMAMNRGSGSFGVFVKVGLAFKIADVTAVVAYFEVYFRLSINVWHFGLISVNNIGILQLVLPKQSVLYVASNLGCPTAE